MTGGEFVLWVLAYCAGLILFVILSEIAISNRGRDPWAWVLIVWLLGFPFVWVASVV